MGTSLAVAVAVGTALLTLLFVKNGAAFSDMKYFCIVAAVLILLFILCDITKNRKDRAKITYAVYAVMSLSRRNSSRNKADSLLFLQRVQGKPTILYKGTQFGVSYRCSSPKSCYGKRGNRGFRALCFKCCGIYKQQLRDRTLLGERRILDTALIIHKIKRRQVPPFYLLRKCTFVR